jgi:YggT family protein
VALLIQLLKVASMLVIADAVFTWVLKPNQFPRTLTKPLLDPVYAPLRRALLPITGSIDLSPLIVLAALYALQSFLERNTSRGS